MMTAYEENKLCLELLEGDGQTIEHILNNFNDGKGRYTNDTIGFALMGIAKNIQRIDNELKRLRAQSNALNSCCY